MLDSFVTSSWVARILGQIIEADFLDLVLVVVSAEDTDAPGGFSARVRRFRRHGLFSLYYRWDQKRHRARAPQDDAFAPVDVSELVEHARVLRVLPLRPSRHEHRFEPFTIEQIENERLDVMLRFGFKIIRGEILNSARYGVWSFHHGDNRAYRGGPALFWEIYEGNPVSGTVLQILTEDLDGGKVIYRSFSATHWASLYSNQNDTFWKTSAFMLRRLRDLHTRGWDSITSLPSYSERVSYDKPIYRLPRNFQMLKFFLKLAFRTIGRRWRSLLLRGQWLIGYGKTSDGLDQLPELKDLRLVKPPRKRFFADPFVTAWRGRHVVFFEDYQYSTGVAHISYIELQPEGFTEPRPALKLPYHLSYPFTFQVDNKLYMIPETADHRTIELYRAKRFPDEWVLDRVLMDDVYAVDATLLFHDERFWLFANMLEQRPGRIEDELFLFSSQSLEGEWAPHPLNPIVSDVRSARPAGRIFRHEGALIRPAQDSSRRYGGAIVLNRIEVLSDSDYRETPIGRIEPNWARGLVGTHCYTSDGTFETVDGFRERLRRPW
jgi:hypothetical protein